MNAVDMTDQEFACFQSMLFEHAGISLPSHKKHLVVSRLGKRLRKYQLSSFGEYWNLVCNADNPTERQIAIDLLTTNETYFFREPKHFEFLQSHLESDLKKPNLRVWSAACSYGQEPYSIAMLLADRLGYREWEVIASDISTKVLASAKKGLYPIEQAEKIPDVYLKKYCLKGVGEYDGHFLIDPQLQRKIKFSQINLNDDLPNTGSFDIIFLRNIMIYFDHETKARLIQKLQNKIKVGGYLLIGHSETLNGIKSELSMISPSIYQRAPGNL